jgi:predicted AlkP superfamily pyrophosphatase or phosphodiesterase
LVVVLLGAYIASAPWRIARKHSLQTAVSNGTSLFGPTTILISLDGFRADFLQRGLTPTLSSFIAQGVSPQYMNPSFPSVTFPNHWTLATGLYPESHGIVGNTFWDVDWQEEFYYTQSEHSMQPKWWGGEPIWVTAENNGFPSAIHMWPGSEAHVLGVEPTFLDKFNGSEGLQNKVDRVLGLLDLPSLLDDPNASSYRPQLIAAYVPNVDTDGHHFGPNSTEILKTIQDVDTMLGNLFQGISDRNLTDIVNIVVVSDHGMATTANERLIQLEDLVDPALIEHTDGWPLYGLRPRKEEDLHTIYQSILTKSLHNPNFDVYLRDTNMPARYHFSQNERIAPLWIVPKAGWAIVTKHEFDIEAAKTNNEIYSPRGLHGYDHEHPLMRAIFVARGPAFPHEPNSRIENFQNIEVYNIVCDSLGLEPKPNNGTLRLPLKTVGTHDDEEAKVPIPFDPPAPGPVTVAVSKDFGTPTSILTKTTSTSPGGSGSAIGGKPKPKLPAVSPQPEPAPAPAPENKSDKETEDMSEDEWWDMVMKKINEWVDWTIDGFPASSASTPTPTPPA